MDKREKEEMISFLFQSFLWYTIWIAFAIHTGYTKDLRLRIGRLEQLLEQRK